MSNVGHDYPDERRAVKVLYCENNTDGTVGGSYYSLLYLVKNLDRRLYHPIVVFYANHSLMAAFREAGIEIHIWPKAKAFTFGVDSFRRSWLRPICPFIMIVQKVLNVLRAFIWPALAKAWFLKMKGVRVVHLNNSILYNHDWMLAARLAGVKCLTHERGINDYFSKSAKYFGRRLDAVVCISEAVRQNMRERGAGFDNLEMIHNGLDPDALVMCALPHEVRARYGIDKDMAVIGMIGNIKEWKGQGTLIRAMDLVRRACNDTRCVLVGDTAPGDREYERSLHALVASLGLDKHIIFTGFQQNVADLILMVDVVVHASVLPEPFGRVVLEAMACKKPVIGSRAGGIPEIIEEGETGLTFLPGDAPALANAILELVRNREKARRFGENGYARLLSKFHIAGNIDATQRVYERMLGEAT